MSSSICRVAASVSLTRFENSRRFWRDLPSTMLVVHQFTASMITNKQAIRGTPTVQVVIHMDGFGSLSLKRNSYARVVVDLPAGALTGWKNFYDEDQPTPTAQQTIDNAPRPTFISYQ